MYQSTRGGVGGVRFEDALLCGYASDGGLHMPAVVPVVDVETLRSWSDLPYVELAKRIIPMFVPEAEIPHTHVFGTNSRIQCVYMFC